MSKTLEIYCPKCHKEITTIGAYHNTLSMEAYGQGWHLQRFVCLHCGYVIEFTVVVNKDLYEGRIPE